MSVTLAEFFEAEVNVVRITLSAVAGSSPREAGAEMFVAPKRTLGTIGGGQLEYMALDRARAMLACGENHTHMNVSLGPEIGQCCGGRVNLQLERLTAAALKDALEAATAAEKALPQVLIFGAGHVGRALARAMAPLPVRLRLIDSRREELALAGDVHKSLTALPESEIASANPGAAFVILTHDHALDFLLAAAALGRDDAAYVGMIGSATKRARFEHWARDFGGVTDTAGLICPMGRAGLGDKRPEVIAAYIVTEVLGALSTQSIPNSMEQNA